MAAVLLAEPDAAMARALADFLAGRGHDVHTAGCFADTMAAVGQRSPDLILLNLEQPGALVGLSDLRAVSDAGILVYGSCKRDAMLALAFGADDFMRPPLGLAELAARVDAVVRRVTRSRRGPYSQG